MIVKSLNMTNKYKSKSKKTHFHVFSIFILKVIQFFFLIAIYIFSYRTRLSKIHCIFLILYRKQEHQILFILLENTQFLPHLFFKYEIKKI